MTGRGQVGLRARALLTALAAALTASVCAPAAAQPVVAASVAELPKPMPAVPKGAGLVEFEFNTTSRHRFAVDPASMSLHGNTILQLTVVVTSSSGAANVSYQAFNCDNGTRLLMAIAGADGSWQAVANPEWVSARRSGPSQGQHYAIYQAACVGGALSGDRDKILRRLVSPPNDLYHSQ